MLSLFSPIGILLIGVVFIVTSMQITLQSTSPISFSPEWRYHTPKEYKAFPLLIFLLLQFNMSETRLMTFSPKLTPILDLPISFTDSTILQSIQPLNLGPSFVFFLLSDRASPIPNIINHYFLTILLTSSSICIYSQFPLSWLYFRY